MSPEALLAPERTLAQLDIEHGYYQGGLTGWTAVIA
jgi:hypothetical protein